MAPETRAGRFDKVREIRFYSGFFFLLGFGKWPERFFGIFWIFAKDLLRKWEANIPSRVKLDGQSIGSILRGRRDLQHCRTVLFVSKNVLKCKSATCKKYGGKLKIGGSKIYVRMCGGIFFWTAGEGPRRFAWLVVASSRNVEILPWERSETCNSCGNLPHYIGGT